MPDVNRPAEGKRKGVTERTDTATPRRRLTVMNATFNAQPGEPKKWYMYPTRVKAAP